MCVIALKYLEKYGWVGGKNRDRAYKPIVHIKKSFRRDTERLFIWDDGTKWTEGINEYGVGIISAASGSPKEMKKDEKAPKDLEKLQSKDGKRIRTALFEKTVDSALKQLIEDNVIGNTAIFSDEKCVLLESAVMAGEYKYETREFKKDEILVRTNHGIVVPGMGYQHGDNRKSSEVRRDMTIEKMEDASSPKDVLDALSQVDKKDPQFAPLRKVDKSSSEMQLWTSGQLIVMPKEKSLHYKPLNSKVEFDLNKLNSEDHKTKFEVISNNNLLELRGVSGFLEFLEL